MSDHMYDQKALTLVDRFESYVGMMDSLVSTSEVLKVSIFHQLLADLRDDYDRQVINYKELRSWLTKKNECGDLITRYNLLDDTPLGIADQVGSEIKQVVAKFAEFNADSDGEGEEMEDKGGDGEQQGGDLALPKVCEDFLAHVRKQEKTLKYFDEVTLRAALASNLIDEKTKEQYVVTTETGGKFQKHISEVFPARRANDMAARMELLCLVRDFGSTAKSYTQRNTSSHTTSTYHRPSTPAPRDKALSFACTTSGFLSYVRIEHEYIDLPNRNTLPEWGTVCSMFANEPDEECISSLSTLGFDYDAARKVIRCFRVFFKAHLEESKKKTNAVAQGKTGLDEDAPAEEKDPDADEEGNEKGGGYMSRADQMADYLKGHPDLVAKDNLRRNKNLDFYRGAKKMQPYDCYIHEFHEGLEAALAAEAGTNQKKAAAVADQAEDGMGAKSKSHEDPESENMNEGGASSAAAKRGARAKGKGWFGNYSRLEAEHSYIQWLFPIQEGGGMSSTSQRLHKHELDIFRQDTAVQARFIRSYQTILDFWGMVLADKETGVIVRKADNKWQYDNLNTSSHNYLRITRVLKCLGEIGYERFKRPWVEFFLREMYEHQELTNCHSSCTEYWMKTMRNPEDAKYLEDLQEELEKKHGEIKPTYSYRGGGGGGGVDAWWENVGPDLPQDPDFDESAVPPPGADSAAAAFDNTPGEPL